MKWIAVRTLWRWSPRKSVDDPTCMSTYCGIKERHPNHIETWQPGEVVLWMYPDSVYVRNGWVIPN